MHEGSGGREAGERREGSRHKCAKEKLPSGGSWELRATCPSVAHLSIYPPTAVCGSLGAAPQEPSTLPAPEAQAERGRALG